MLWAPILWGAGLGAASSLLQKKDPITGALIGGVTGGVLGNVGGATEVSGVGGSTGGVSGVGTVPTGAGASGGVSSSGIVPGSLESEGLMKTIGDGSTLYNQDYFANVLGNPIYKGGEGLLSNAADEAGSMFGNLAPENLSGVASLLDSQQNTQGYQQMAGTGGGGVSRGNANNLAIEFPQAKVSKRRKA